MAQVTTKRNSFRFPTGAPASRQPAYMGYGEGQAQTQFLGTASRELFGIASREGQQAYSQQMTDAGIRTSTFLNDLNEKIRNDPNPDRYNDYYKETFEQIKGLAQNFTTTRAKIDFLNQINTKAPDWQADINDKIDQRRRINIQSNADILADNITKIDTRDPKIFNETLENITKSAQGLFSIGYTDEQVNKWTQDRIEDIEKNKVLYTALDFVSEGQYKTAQNMIDNSSLQPDEKRQLTYLINHNIAKRQTDIQEELEKKEVEYLLELKNQTLTPDKLASDLATGKITTDLYKEYKRYLDAQAKEQIEGTKETDYDAYDKLRTMIDDYEDGSVSKEYAREQISDAVEKQLITTTHGISLREKLDIKDDPDDPLNKSGVKRGLSILNEMKNNGFFYPEDYPADETNLSLAQRNEGKRQNYLTYLRLTNEYEQWVKANPDATEKQQEDKINELTRFPVEIRAPSALQKISRFMFGEARLIDQILYPERRFIQKPTKTVPVERITVEKDGKRYTLPKEQLAEAIRQGYKQVK